MYKLKVKSECGEPHFEIVKIVNGLEIFEESFDFNEYSQAQATLRNLNVTVA